MDSNSPAILVDLPFCYLPYDHKVRVQIRKLGYAERMRQGNKKARAAAQQGVKLDFQREFFRFEDLAR